jgi:DNA-binding response OmpR family regulator
MDERNRANHQLVVDCTHDELIAAIWEGDQAQGHTPNDVAHVVRDLRLKLEPKPEAPKFLVTVRGGYRLITHPLPEPGPGLQL